MIWCEVEIEIKRSQFVRGQVLCEWEKSEIIKAHREIHVSAEKNTWTKIVSLATSHAHMTEFLLLYVSKSIKRLSIPIDI